MLAEALTAGALVAGGQFLDRLGTKRSRVGALKLLRSARELDWHKFVAHQAWQAYTFVYGSRGSSLKFVVRSYLIYSTLFVSSLAFLSIFFEATFQSVTSVFSYGNSFEILGWIAAVILGGVLYALANAQTLYFLEILKTAPTFFKFFLVAYADFLITASIALFGLPLLLLISSAASIYGSSKVLDISLEFKQSVRSPSVDLLESFGATLDPKQKREIISVYDKMFFFDVDLAVRGSNPDMVRKDFDLTKKLILTGIVKNAEIHKETGNIRVTDDSGSVLGFRERELSFSDNISILQVPKKSETLENMKEEFCRKFSAGTAPDIPHVVYQIDVPSRSRVFDACMREDKTDVLVKARINRENVDLGGIYKFFLAQNLFDLMSALGNGFTSYLELSPFSPLAPQEDRGGWWHTHRIGEIDDRYAVAMDETILAALYTDLGGYNSVFDKATPGGTINFAIMSTSAFIIVVIGFLLIFYPVIILIRRVPSGSKYVNIRKFPYTIAGVVAGFYLSIGSVLI